MRTRCTNEKLLLITVLMLAFGSAHAFTNEGPYLHSWLGEMNQEDYVCGSIPKLQFVLKTDGLCGSKRICHSKLRR